MAHGVVREVFFSVLVLSPYRQSMTGGVAGKWSDVNSQFLLNIFSILHFFRLHVFTMLDMMEFFSE